MFHYKKLHNGAFFILKKFNFAYRNKYHEKYDIP